MPFPQFFPGNAMFLLPHPSLLCVIWGEGGSGPRSVLMVSETGLGIERYRAMKTSEAIKSRARLVSMGYGRSWLGAEAECKQRSLTIVSCNCFMVFLGGVPRESSRRARS